MVSKKILPAVVFDALGFSAFAFGGIGAPEVFDDDGCPVCIWGHAEFAANKNFCDRGNPIMTALDAIGISGSSGFRNSNDDAVYSINERLGKHRETRVPFAAWCKELGVERGS